MKTEGLWNSPSQFAVMQILCFKNYEKLGYAEVSKNYIADRIGIGPRRVIQIFDELEALEAIQRVGPERAGGINRFIITLEKAIAKLFGRGGVKPTSPPLASIAVLSPVICTSPPGEAEITGGGEVEITGGVICTSPPGGGQTVDSTKTVDATRPAAAWLPLFGPAKEKPLQREAAAARDLRLKKLRHRVAGLARSILYNPTFGPTVLAQNVDDGLSELVDQTKWLCARKRVSGYGDVVYAMCVSELFKFRNPKVMNGTDPRPRDLRMNPYETKRGTARRRPRL